VKEWIQLAQDPVAGYEDNAGNAHSGYIKGKEFLDWLSDYQFLKDSAP
jgi:hypothetical protein